MWQQRGGAIYLQATSFLDLQSSQLHSNVAQLGGGIYATHSSQLILSEVNITANQVNVIESFFSPLCRLQLELV